MKGRSNKLMALLLSLSMVAAPVITASPVLADDAPAATTTSETAADTSETVTSTSGTEAVTSTSGTEAVTSTSGTEAADDAATETAIPVEAQEVIDQINALPNADAVTEENREAIRTAEIAYIGLDDDKVEYVSNYDKLEADLNKLAPITPDEAGNYTFTENIQAAYGLSTVEMLRTSASDKLMFRPIAATLNYAADGTMTATITMSSNGNVALYLGSKEDAKKAEDAAGNYEQMQGGVLLNDQNQFTIPVKSLEMPITFATRGKSGNWFDRAIIFHKSNMNKILEDGEYTVNLESSTGMLHFNGSENNNHVGTVPTTVKDGEATLHILSTTVNSRTKKSRFDQMFIGKYADANDEQAIIGTAVAADDGTTNYEFDVKIPASSLVKGNVIYYVLRYTKGYDDTHDGIWYEPKEDFYFTIGDITPAKATSVAMNRLYNPNSGEHFFTSDSAEKENLVNLGWKDEGIGWYAPTTGTKVYRLYNGNGGEHHYTTSEAEKDMLINAGWKDEGIGWYSADEKTGVPVYRVYNPNKYANNHHYTTNEAEKDYLISIGWRDEKIGWYGVKN